MSKVEIIKIKEDVFLYINDYLWMWDTEQERTEQKLLAQQAFGDVLVAGYGLGVLQRLLLQNKDIHDVRTIEIDPNVIQAARNHYGHISGSITIGDFYTCPWASPYDCVIGDCWQDITPRCLPDYIKFKEAAFRATNKSGLILAWGQEFFEYLLATKNPGTS